MSHLFIQCVAGSLGGFTTTILTNPLDIVRARLQVCYILFVLMQRNNLYDLFSLKGSSSRLNERRLPRVMARGEAQLFL